MIKMERRFHKALEHLVDWFNTNARVLPWRSQPDVYRVWVSEIMLQQTQVITVLPYFERFIKRFPTVKDLAKAKEEDVLIHWSGLGYYSRARNLHRAAQMVLESGFPVTLEGWLELPGVGRYTAGAVMSIAYNLPYPILDGNVERVLSRLRRVANTDAVQAKKRLWRLSTAFVERGHRLGFAPSIVNQALMELGATHCSPKKPTCGLCPLSRFCKANAIGDREMYPIKRGTKKWVKVQEQVECVTDAEGRVLLEKQVQGQWRKGLWDFPKEIPSRIRDWSKAFGEMTSRYVVTRHKVDRKVKLFMLKDSPTLREAAERVGLRNLKWFSLSEIKKNAIPLGSPTRKALDRLSDQLAERLALKLPSPVSKKVSGKVPKQLVAQVSRRQPKIKPKQLN